MVITDKELVFIFIYDFVCNYVHQLLNTRIPNGSIILHAHFTDDIMYHKVTIHYLISLSIFTLGHFVK
jgi:hypothetical protein